MDASAVGVGQDLVGEVEGAGVVDVPHAEPLQHAPLLGAADGGIDLGTDAAGDLDGRHAHAAGGGVDQDPLARLQVGQAVEAVLRGEVGDRDRGGVGERDRRRLAYDRAGGREDVAVERLGRDPEHLVADGEIADGGPGGDDHAGALDAGRTGVTRVHPEDIEHVAEVQACGPDLDLDLVRAGNATGRRGEGDVVERPRARQQQLVRGGRAPLGSDPRQARDMPTGGAERDLVLAAGRVQFGAQLGDGASRNEGVEIDARAPQARLLVGHDAPEPPEGGADHAGRLALDRLRAAGHEPQAGVQVGPDGELAHDGAGTPLDQRHVRLELGGAGRVVAAVQCPQVGHPHRTGTDRHG